MLLLPECSVNQLKATDVRPISVGKSAVLLFIYQCLMFLGGMNMRVKTFDKNILSTLLDWIGFFL